MALVFRYNLGTPKGSTGSVLVVTWGPGGAGGTLQLWGETSLPTSLNLTSGSQAPRPPPALRPARPFIPARVSAGPTQAAAPLREGAKPSSPSAKPLAPAKPVAPKAAPPGRCPHTGLLLRWGGDPKRDGGPEALQFLTKVPDACVLHFHWRGPSARSRPFTPTHGGRGRARPCSWTPARPRCGPGRPAAPSGGGARPGSGRV